MINPCPHARSTGPDSTSNKAKTPVHRVANQQLRRPATATEFGADGSVLWHASLPEGMYSYRAHLFDWTGTPSEPPAVVAHRDEAAESGPIEVAMSWNGATEVAAWRISSGPGSDGPTRITEVAATGFETVATVPAESDPTDVASPTFVTVEALDEAGVVLGASETVEASDAR